MDKTGFDPGRALGVGIGKMRRQELCALVSELCTQIRKEVGADGYRGGIYPENIGLNEDGAVTIGEARMSDWSEEERRFLAPELYWGGKASPAADVYSLGMLLYYGATGGHLPFENEGREQAEADRMNGKGFAVPTIVPRQLREVIIKATSFQAGDRYQQVDEMGAMVESCIQNKYLKGEESSQALFQKDNRELSDLERIMVSIIDEDNGDLSAAGEDKAEKTEAEAETPEQEAKEAEAETEKTAEEKTEPVLGIPPEKREEDLDALAAEEAEMERLRALFNAPIEEPKLNDGVVPEIPSEEAPTQAEDDLQPVPLAMIGEEGDVRVYEPVRGYRDNRGPERQPIPILTVDDNPELAPVIPQNQVMGAVNPARQGNRAGQVSDDVRKRRKRPVLVVLVLCALLILSAIVANAMLSDGGTWRRSPAVTGDPNADASGLVSIPTAPPTDSPVTPFPEDTVDYSALDPEKDIDNGEAAAPIPHRYEVIAANDSWTEAKAACEAMGGYLAVIGTEEEFNMITELVAESGLSRVWVGCHREEGSLVWEKADEVLFYPWDNGEPSYEDAYDGAEENYLLLWYHNGWVYNDSRDDPVADYPEWYVGTIGYVCEFDA